MMRMLMPLLFAGILPACSGGTAEKPESAEKPATTDAAPAEKPLQKVRLALNWYPEPEFGGFYEGVVGGHYKDAGFDVEIIPGGPGAPSLELVSTGQAEAAITVADDFLVKRNKGGIKATAVFPSFQTNPAGVMVHKASGIDSFDDIQAGQVAIEIGAPLQTFLWKKYSWEGKVEPVPYGGTVGPFIADPKLAQQAYITSEPCIARGQGADVTFLKAADAGWNPYAAVLAVADPPPAWTADFVAATKKAWEAYLASPDRANAEMVKGNDQLTPDLIACITEAQRPFVAGEDGLGVMTAARWDATNAALIDMGLLPPGSSAAGAWKSY